LFALVAFIVLLAFVAAALTRRNTFRLIGIALSIGAFAVVTLSCSGTFVPHIVLQALFLYFRISVDVVGFWISASAAATTPSTSSASPTTSPPAVTSSFSSSATTASSSASYASSWRLFSHAVST